jgi:hypothetical protein
MGAASTRHSLRPLIAWGEDTCTARARNAPREGGGATSQHRACMPDSHKVYYGTFISIVISNACLKILLFHSRFCGPTAFGLPDPFRRAARWRYALGRPIARRIAAKPCAEISNQPAPAIVTSLGVRQRRRRPPTTMATATPALRKLAPNAATKDDRRKGLVFSWKAGNKQSKGG